MRSPLKFLDKIERRQVKFHGIPAFPLLYAWGAVVMAVIVILVMVR